MKRVYIVCMLSFKTNVAPFSDFKHELDLSG